MDETGRKLIEAEFVRGSKEQPTPFVSVVNAAMLNASQSILFYHCVRCLRPAKEHSGFEIDSLGIIRRCFDRRGEPYEIG